VLSLGVEDVVCHCRDAGTAHVQTALFLDFPLGARCEGLAQLEVAAGKLPGAWEILARGQLEGSGGELTRPVAALAKAADNLALTVADDGSDAHTRDVEAAGFGSHDCGLGDGCAVWLMARGLMGMLR
jgi:hypothetical protein